MVLAFRAFRKAAAPRPTSFPYSERDEAHGAVVLHPCNALESSTGSFVKNVVQNPLQVIDKERLAL